MPAAHKSVRRKLAGVLLAVSALSACGTTASSGSGLGNSSKCAVVFGANTEVSGSEQTYGGPAAEGLRAAAAAINRAGGVMVGGRHCTFVAEIADNRSDPSQVYTATQQVIDDHAIAALGPDLNDQVAYAAFRRAGVIDFSVESDLAADLKSHPSSYPLLVSLIPDQLTEHAEYFRQAVAAEPGIRRVALLYAGNELGQAEDQTTVQALRAVPGLKLVSNLSFPDGTTDFSTLLTKIRGSRPDLLFSLAGSQGDPEVISQAVPLRVAKYYMSETMTAEAVLQLRGIGNTTVLLPTFAPTYSQAETLPTDHPSVIFGHRPVPLVPGAAIVLYYAAWLVKQAVERADSTQPQAVFRSLVGQSYTGPFGTCRMSRQLFMTCSTVFIVVKGRQLTVDEFASPYSSTPAEVFACSDDKCRAESG